MARCRCAPSLIVLRNQVDVRWPGRDRSSDGCCGDAAHAARVSDHNPAPSGPGKGYAHALDIDEDVVANMGDRPLWETGVLLLSDRRTKYCLAPDVNVLCADLSWRPIASLAPGDRLVAFDEYGAERAWKKGDERTRGAQMRTGEVEEVHELRLPSVRLATERGEVTCSTDHMWLVRPRPGERHRRWVRAEDLAPERDEIVYFGDPWTREQGTHAGWVGGMFDGEGCLSRPTANDKLWGWGLSVAQRPGIVLDQLRGLLGDFGVSFGEYSDRHGVNSLQIRGGLPGILAFLGRFPTSRLRSMAMEREIWDGAQIGKSFAGALVKAVEPVGLSDVVSVQTSTRTLIADGYLSHNCIYEAQLLYPDGTVKAYHGINAHRHHLHVSIKPDATFATEPWPLPAITTTPGPRPAPEPTPEDLMANQDFFLYRESNHAEIKLFEGVGKVTHITNGEVVKDLLNIYDQRPDGPGTPQKEWVLRSETVHFLEGRA